ncbi:MAG: hypothetical protein LQ338_002090, partial [Usnochroma carphineum]
ELEERERAPEYSAEDLAGVKVAHGLGDFVAGGEQILTLKDAGIDENEEEGDELENQDLKEREALEERLNLKKRKPVYDPHSNDEAGDATILKHYDEAIEGKKRKRFTLDGLGSTTEEREATRQTVGETLKPQSISLYIQKDIPTSDYKEAQEAKIRKPKKRKIRSTRQRLVDDDDIFPSEAPNGSAANGAAMEVDLGLSASGAVPLASAKEAISFVDDEDLQAQLAIQRREALKKRKRTKPEDLARQLRLESEEAKNKMDEDDQADEGGLIIDETTEFVANLRNSPEPRKPRTEASRPTLTTKQESPTAEDDHDIDMDRAYNDTPDPEERFKRETSTPTAPELTGTGLDEEANINQGVGATLALLSQRGLIRPATNDGNLNALHRDRQRFLAEKRKREAEAERKARAQRERDRASGKLDRMSARDREEHARWENKQRDQAESRQMAEIFNREYKPNVELKYVDEFGRSMNQKEAFKHLSHQFHGKGSGKQKTEKHLKRIEDDKRREAMSSLDASQATGMNNAMGATARKNRQAVRLHLLFAIPVLIQLATYEPHHELAIFVHDVSAAAARDVDAVAVQKALGHQGKLGEDRRGGGTYQSMALRFLEVVAPVQRIEPRVQEELGPVASLQYQAPLTQALAVLRQYQIDPIALEIRKCLDHAVWRRKGEEVVAVRVDRHSVTKGGDKSPASRVFADVVVCDVGEEGRVAYPHASSAHVLLTEHFNMRGWTNRNTVHRVPGLLGAGKLPALEDCQMRKEILRVAWIMPYKARKLFCTNVLANLQLFTPHLVSNITMSSATGTDRPPPSTTSVVVATAILAVALGYFIGQGSTLGLFGSTKPAGRSKSKNPKKSWPNSYDVTIHPDSSDEEVFKQIRGADLGIESEESSQDSSEEEDGAVELGQKQGELNTFEGNKEECKLVLVVRTDLGMGKGKMAAQCSHATLACYRALSNTFPASLNPVLKQWERMGQAKVVVQAKNEEELETLQAQAISLGLCAQIIHDAGRTQIASGSATVLGVGPGPKSVVDQVTGGLKLL